MSVFELDTKGQAALAEEASLNPIGFDQVGTGPLTGVGTGVGSGIMRGGARVGQFIGMAAAAPLALYERATDQEGRFTDPYFRALDEHVNDAVDFWTPNQAEVGTVGRMLGGFSEIALPLMAGAGNPTLLIGAQELGLSTDLAREGVDAKTAVAGGLVQGASVGVGFRLPFLGKTLASRIATGAGGNLALNTGTTAAQQALFSARGYKEMAAQYDPLDIEARAVDVLTGIAFGGVAHAQMRSSDRAAVAAAANAKHFQRDTMPGMPGDMGAQVAHQQALETAIDQLLKGEAVEVLPAVLEADFKPRDASATQRARIEAARDEGLPEGPEVPRMSPLVPERELESLAVPEEVRASLTEAYRHAAEVKPTFDATVRAIADELGTPHEPLVPAKLKNLSRAAEKTIADYGGDASRLKDIVRATIVVDDLTQAARAVELIQERFGDLRKFRNTLRGEVLPSDGYRDINTNVMVGGHVVELQVNLPEMLKAKSEMHALYKERRTIAKQIEDGRLSSDVMTAAIKRRQDLDAQMSERYAAAWNEALSRSKVSAEMGSPSESASVSLNGRPSGTSKAKVSTPPEPSGRQTTGMPSTSQKIGSLPKTGEGRDIADSSGTILPESGKGAESIDITAARQAIAESDFQVPTGEVDAAGNPVTVSARQLLADADAEVARAENDAKGFGAAVACFLANGAE